MEWLFLFYSPSHCCTRFSYNDRLGTLKPWFAPNGDNSVWRTKEYLAIIDIWSLANSFPHYTLRKWTQVLVVRQLFGTLLLNVGASHASIKQAEGSVSFTYSPFSLIIIHAAPPICFMLCFSSVVRFARNGKEPSSSVILQGEARWKRIKNRSLNKGGI